MSQCATIEGLLLVNVGTSKSGDQDRLVLRHVEGEGPIEGEFIAFDADSTTQRGPSARGIARFVDEVVADFTQNPRRDDELPALPDGEIEDLARRAGGGKARGQSDAAIEENFQLLCRRRSPSASSSASIEATSSSE
jgi:hypothetical protein